MADKCCYLCYFYRLNDRSEPICCKIGKNMRRKSRQQLEQLVERCKGYRADETFRRIKYPVGITPEESEELRRADILRALREEG